MERPRSFLKMPITRNLAGCSLLLQFEVESEGEGRALFLLRHFSRGGSSCFCGGDIGRERGRKETGGGGGECNFVELFGREKASGKRSLSTPPALFPPPPPIICLPAAAAAAL